MYDVEVFSEIVAKHPVEATEFVAELVRLVERGDVELRPSGYDLDEINEIAEMLYRREIEGRAVITP